MVNTYHKPFFFPLLLETSEAHRSLCLLTYHPIGSTWSHQDKYLNYLTWPFSSSDDILRGKYQRTISIHTLWFYIAPMLFSEMKKMVHITKIHTFKTDAAKSTFRLAY